MNSTKSGNLNAIWAIPAADDVATVPPGMSFVSDGVYPGRPVTVPPDDGLTGRRLPVLLLGVLYMRC